MSKHNYIKYLILMLIICMTFNITITYCAPNYYINNALPIPSKLPYDKDGIKMHDYGGTVGYQYNILFIANDAIDFYNDYVYIPNGYIPKPQYKDAFFDIISWLEKNNRQTSDSIYYQYNYEVRGAKSPWQSAITQARVGKVFLLAYKMSGEKKYLEYVRLAIAPIFRPISKGGFLYNEDNIYFFEEYVYPKPDHVLNGHMSVLLDLNFINTELKDNKIQEWIDKGVYSLKQVLPKYEMYDKMAFALNMEPGSSFYDNRPIANTYKSYDRVHMHYLNELYKITKDKYFEDYYWRYITAVELRDQYTRSMNILSPPNLTIGGDIMFSEDINHDINSVFNNYYKDPNIYAVSQNNIREASFTITLDENVFIDNIEMRFHWFDYPRNFQIEAYSDNKWVTVCKVSGYNPQSSLPEYNYIITEPLKCKKIRFHSSDFSNQQRLILDYMFIYKKMEVEDTLVLWKKIIDESAFKSINTKEFEQNINRFIMNNRNSTVSSLNRAVVEYIAEDIKSIIMDKALDNYRKNKSLGDILRNLAN